MATRPHIVQVPVTFWFQVQAKNLRDAHWEGVKAFEWICQAITGTMGPDDGMAEFFPTSPPSFDTYRVLASFDKAMAVRGDLDIRDDEDPNTTEDADETGEEVS